MECCMDYRAAVSVIVTILAAAATTGRAFGGQEPQVVARLERAPGNITVTPHGRIIVSLHQFYDPPYRVAEVMRDGTLRPYPNRQWAAGAGPEALDSVLGIQSDAQGVVWMLDNGRRTGATPKLVGWDSRRDRLVRIIYLPPPIVPPDGFVNDLAVDVRHHVVYIADPAGGDNAALVVVNLETGQARRVLEGHRGVVPEHVDLVIDGRPLQRRLQDGTLVRPRIGVNPIALDAANEWLYFGPMHGNHLYRIRTKDLRNPTLTAPVLAARVERYSDKPICDGISIDTAGNVYISDIANYAIGVIDPSRRYRILAQGSRLSWPDAFSFGPDGQLYTVANQLHESAVLNAGVQTAEPPYLVLRVEPLASGIPGR